METVDNKMKADQDAVANGSRCQRLSPEAVEQLCNSDRSFGEFCMSWRLRHFWYFGSGCAMMIDSISCTLDYN